MSSRFPERKFQNEIDHAFSKRKALICYAPIGDPLAPSWLIDTYVECGVDIIEIGLPTRNPYADGEVIASSMRRTCDAMVSVADIAAHTRDITDRHPTLAKIWMCYECADLSKFGDQAGEMKLDGLLILGFGRRNDKEKLAAQMARSHVHHVGFVGLESSPEELERAKQASGYIFYQTVDGKTGIRSGDLDPSLADRIANLRRAGVSEPIALGFGISTPAQVRQATEFGADGIITGSACVSAALESKAALVDYLNGIRAALDDASRTGAFSLSQTRSR